MYNPLIRNFGQGSWAWLQGCVFTAGRVHPEPSPSSSSLVGLEVLGFSLGDLVNTELPLKGPLKG